MHDPCLGKQVQSPPGLKALVSYAARRLHILIKLLEGVKLGFSVWRLQWAPAMFEPLAYPIPQGSQGAFECGGWVLESFVIVVSACLLLMLGTVRVSQHVPEHLDN